MRHLWQFHDGGVFRQDCTEYSLATSHNVDGWVILYLKWAPTCAFRELNAINNLTRPRNITNTIYCCTCIIVKHEESVFERYWVRAMFFSFWSTESSSLSVVSIMFLAKMCSGYPSRSMCQWHVPDTYRLTLTDLSLWWYRSKEVMRASLSSGF